MFKFWKVLSVLVLLSAGLLTYLPQSVSAASCSFTYNPPTPNQDMDKLQITVSSGDLADGENYRLQLKRPNNTADQKLNLILSGNRVTAEFNKPPYGWLQGTYTLNFKRGDAPGLPDKNLTCTGSFTISEISAQQCTASIPTKPIEPGTEVFLHVEGLEERNRAPIDIDGTGGYDVTVFNQSKKVVASIVYSTASGPDISLGNKFDTGTYLVEIRKRCGFLGTACQGPPRIECNSVAFTVAKKGSGGGGEVSADTVKQGIQCKQAGEPFDPQTDTLCTASQAQIAGCGDGIKTAIGCIHTDPSGFVKDFLTFITAISGGLAFLMMLLGAFQMLTSAGNPESLQAGRDRFSSAIIGLLIVILAVLFLKIIGFDILRIPGFQ